MTGNEKIIFSVIVATFLAGLIIQDYYKSTATLTQSCPTSSCAIGLYEPEIKASQKISVDLNTATVDELIKIPGVGTTLAKKIIVYREEHPFKSVNELIEIKGIGERTFLQIRDYFVVTVETQDK
ncbi:MAG: helix-hairpin-helix domain-containing protein [Candidatus Auribacter fodinae]|uniref:Helix-hairpin-helix domain-containing protein n=1 Tax=Candidatus Auribacter fodinae TaxID=2093366 RepID=A0A3A4R369_9BACT|nr:MAG: helix-hairpin-helix domain-containing protein [Candidatus Auribacter fodinae]